VDRASMANGLEVRPPLLDHELLELAARIPSRLKVRRGETKWVFREALRSQLPANILGRRKHGFDVPLDAWLRGPLRERFEDSVLGPQARVAELVSQDVARQLYRAHQVGIGRHGQLLWTLLVLACWSERYLKPAAKAAGGLP